MHKLVDFFYVEVSLQELQVGQKLLIRRYLKALQILLTNKFEDHQLVWLQI